MRRNLLILASLLAIVFILPGQCSGPHVHVVGFTFPKNVSSLLVLVDRLPGKDRFVADNAEQVTVALRYITPHTSWKYIDDATADEAAKADAVVYVGVDGLKWLKRDRVNVLRQARRLIVTEHHLRQISAEKIAFLNAENVRSTIVPNGTEVEYRGIKAPIALDEFLRFTVHAPVETLATYQTPQGPQADIIVDGNVMFINSPLWFDTGDELHPQIIAACDAIAQFLHVRGNPQPLAMLRLEDVSVLTPPDRLDAIVRYLAQVGAPYGIGVIPDLQVKGKRGGELSNSPKLVAVLDWAQHHGATLILHGLHHCCSSEDAEGYEFWDFDRRRPRANDSATWMRRQIVEGLFDDAAVGLHPTMWETPHYAASPTDYRIIAKYFPVSWELRDPVAWVPWPLQRDQYGSIIVPENLGYVSLDGTKTVHDQLNLAHQMLMCRYCVAVGFLHPAVLDVGVFRDYVESLSTMGYAFVDPQSFIPR